MEREGDGVAAEGLHDGHCPFMGRRIVHLVHGGPTAMKANIPHRTTHYNEPPMKAPGNRLSKVVAFHEHVSGRLINWTCGRLDYILEPPVMMTGLLLTLFKRE